MISGEKSKLAPRDTYLVQELKEINGSQYAELYKRESLKDTFTAMVQSIIHAWRQIACSILILIHFGIWLIVVDILIVAVNKNFNRRG